MTDPKEPAWLTALVDQRMALIEHKASPLIDSTAPSIVMTSLTEPEEDTRLALDHWEQSCDNCKAYRPNGIHSGTITRYTKAGVQVIITFGVCAECFRTFE